MSGSGYLKFRNDRGVPEICIGVKEFECIGESPPQDHPHIYINMGEADTILCPYCGTRFRFDSRLTPLDADPPDSFFATITRPEQSHSLGDKRHASGRQRRSRKMGQHAPPLCQLLHRAPDAHAPKPKNLEEYP